MITRHMNTGTIILFIKNKNRIFALAFGLYFVALRVELRSIQAILDKLEKFVIIKMENIWLICHKTMLLDLIMK